MTKLTPAEIEHLKMREETKTMTSPLPRLTEEQRARFEKVKFCKCKNGRPCFDTMFNIEVQLAQEISLAISAERERIAKIVNLEYDYVTDQGANNDFFIGVRRMKDVVLSALKESNK